MPKFAGNDELVSLIYDVINFKFKDETIIAQTGRLLDDGSLTLTAGAEPGKIWVTMANGQAHQVWAIQGIALRHNITVEIRYNIHDELYVDRLAEAENVRTFGSGALSMSVPDRAAELVRESIATKNLQHMRIQASNPVDLSVFLPAGYFEWQGAVRYWGGGAVAITAPSTSLKHRMTLVSLDRNTLTLTATNGNEFGTVQSIGEPQLNDIAVGAEHLRLGGARVANGQTTIGYNDIVDGRMVFSQWPGFTLYPTTIPGEMTIPSGYRAGDWVGSMSITGKLTVHGGTRNIPRKVAA